MTSDTRKRTGNYKPGPGRPPGARNKKTLALEAALREATSDLDQRFHGNALGLLQWVYGNEKLPLETRILAASKALKCESPTLSSTQGRLEISVGMADRVKAARARVIDAGVVPVALPNAMPDAVDVEGIALDDMTVIDGAAVVVDGGMGAP